MKECRSRENTSQIGSIFNRRHVQQVYRVYSLPLASRPIVTRDERRRHEIKNVFSTRFVTRGDGVGSDRTPARTRRVYRRTAETLAAPLPRVLLNRVFQTRNGHETNPRR